jgi:mannose-6-phosphate isomerase-like protein (cupin superfamily)
VEGARAQVLEPDQGRSLAAVGTSVLLKTVAADTGRRWTMYEYTAAPGFAGPPPHWHKQTDEAFFVLEGTIRFEVDAESVDAQPGAYARVPPRVVHRFSNPSDEQAQFIGLIVPGGFEKYWEELGEMMAKEPSSPPADMGPVMALMAKYDTFPPPAA